LKNGKAENAVVGVQEPRTTLPRNTVTEAFGRVNVDGDPGSSVATGG